MLWNDTALDPMDPYVIASPFTLAGIMLVTCMVIVAAVFAIGAAVSSRHRNRAAH